MYITAQGTRLQNDLYCVECDVKLYYTYTYSFYAMPDRMPDLNFRHFEWKISSKSNFSTYS